ncbi:amino acid adenylation domain-containing protein, partial [Flavobacterium pectinovorum]
LNLAKINSPRDLAYLIYTSGTTGNPKGVMIEHTSLVNRLTWMQKAYPLSCGETLIQKTTYSFDVSVWELVWWAIYGAKLSVAKSGAEKDPAQLIQNIDENQVTVIHFVPAMLSVFLEYVKENPNEKERIKSLKQVFVSGEALTLHQRDLFYKELSGISLMNLYGPTEASIDVSYYDCAEQHNISSVPIGRPIDNISLYILDEKLSLKPIGSVGKLYIAGVGVARGYLNKTALTEEKFVNNPFIEGTKMYDTGDLAKWLADGNIEYIGRKDHQVKIRGFRIELGEIETHLFQYSNAIKNVIVEIKEVNQEKVIVAYYVSESKIDKIEIRHYLEEKLPEYMIPNFYIALDSIPVTSNGKVDRKALPSVTADDIIRGEYVAPKNETQDKLAAIWQDVLGIEKVGITDNFFNLGGNSLIIGQVINRIHKELHQGITFKAFFSSPTIEEISLKLQAQDFAFIPKTQEKASYPVTKSQHRLWILSQLEGGSLAYNMPAVVKLKGNIDTIKFEESFAFLIQRHEILRTYFKTNKEGQVHQFIVPAEEINFKITEKDFTSEKDQSAVFAYLQENNAIAFDLEQAALIRASLVKLKEDEFVFFLSMHHIIGDGWSIELLVSEIVKIYNALTQGIEAKLPELSIQYKDYSVWLNEVLQQEKSQESKAFWLQQFAGELPVLDLPSFKTRPLVRTYNGNSHTHIFPKEFLNKLKTFSKEHDATLFMTLMAGINALLHRYTGQNDIIIGTPVAGREHPDLENQMGLFLNTLAIRTQFEEKNSFLDLLNKEKNILLEAYEHQNYPFDALLAELNLKRDTSRSALFDVLVVLQNQRQVKSLVNEEQLTGLQIENYEFESRNSKFDITFTFSESDVLTLLINYDSDIYDQSLIKRMFSHFENILIKSLEQPENPIEEIDFLTVEERQELLVGFNDISVDYPMDKTIIDLFEEQANNFPDAIAVVFDDEELTYKELNEKANQLADYLLSNGLKKGDFVLLCYNSHMSMSIVGLLGIMKSGGVYVPLDADIPEERAAYIINDTKANFVITNDADSGIFVNQNIQIITLNNKSDNQFLKEKGLNINNTTPDNLAYLIYTSGTTGAPKGVMVNQQNLTDYFYGLNSRIQIDQAKTFLLMSSLSTDLGNTTLYSSLIYGKTLHLLSKDSLRNIEYVHQYFDQNDIDCIKIVPTFWKALVNENKPLLPKKMIVFGGEELSKGIIEKIKEVNNELKIVNHYGPTETTIGKLIYPVDDKPLQDRTPLGRTFSNASAYVLTEDLVPLPIGIIGNLYISGAGVSNGYLNNPDLTKVKFIDNPFVIGERMYNTGDLVKWLPEGNIEFIGRKDGQVKIQGNRIELGDIEVTIARNQYIKESCVKVDKNSNSENILIAYLVTKEGYDEDEFKEYLTQKMPVYMIPAVLVIMESLPMTSNGKIDKTRLPKIESIKENAEIILPENEVQQTLVIILMELFKKDAICITDNFFELGGNSLLAIQYINSINKKLILDLKLKDIFSKPTVRSLSKFINGLDLKHNSNLVIEKSQKTASLLSSNQRRLWILSQDETESSAYNISTALLIEGTFSVKDFINSYDELIKRHDSFRTRFEFDGENPIQFIQEEAAPIIEIEDFDYLPENEELVKILNKENLISFDLSAAPLSKLKILKLPNDTYFVIIVMHHIISDGWSLNILINEWVEIYNALVTNSKNTLPEVDYTYLDFVSWQDTIKENDEHNENVQYWKNRLEGGIEKLNLIKNQHPVKNDSKSEGDVADFYIEDEVFALLKRISIEQNISLFSILLTSFSVLLHHISDQKNIVLGTSITGRNRKEFESIIGFFVNTLPIKTTINPDETFIDLLIRANADIMQDIDHQNLSLEELVKLNLRGKNDSNALFQGRFVFNEELYDLNNVAEKIQVNKLEIFTPKEFTAKFDFSLVMRIRKNRLLGSLDYKKELFDAQYMDLITESYKHILTRISQNQTEKIHSLNSFEGMYTAYMETKTQQKNKQVFDSFLNYMNK